MDYSKFTLEDFDVKEWINNLVSMIPPETLEKDLTDIAIKLQCYMQEMNTTVDESTQTAFKSLPRIVRDMESVRQEASILQEQMSLIKCDIEKVEKSTQDSMCKLLKIDARKKKLSQIENALQEADSWTQICDNIDGIMKSGDINKIADKISSLQHSLSMLSTAPDFEERQKKVKHLCDNFESMLGPQLIQSFFTNNSEFIRIGLGLLNKINRSEYGSKYYNAWFKPSVEGIWTQCKTINQWTKAEDLLKLFFQELLKFTTQELEKNIFPSSVQVLIVALTESLVHLEEQFDEIVSKQYPKIDDVNRRISLLANCVEVTDQFAKQLESTFQARSTDSHLVDPIIIRRLSVALYSQYNGIDDIFARDCAIYIQQSLNDIKMDSVDVVDSIDVLDASIDTVMELSRNCVKYCQSMTHFTSIDALVDCIKSLLTTYVGEFKRVCVNIILKLSSQQIISPDRTDNLETSIDDYYFLQDGIKLTSLGGHISVVFESFLQEMLNQIGSHIQSLISMQSKSNIFLRNYPNVFIESQSRQNEVVELWKRVFNTDSQVQLLKFPNFKPIEETRQYVKFKLLRWLNKKVFENAIEPMKTSLCDVAKSNIWQEELETGEALPQFAFSPQEYITTIGQFFMTLPQQLEPFFNNNNSYYQESLVNGQLPHLSDHFYNSWLESETRATKVGIQQSNTLQVAHVWLESIVLGCLVHLLEQWLNIPKLSINGRHQLQADINYIVGVVEDLDLQIPSDMNMFTKLIIAGTKDDIAEISSSYQVPIKMVEIVKKILF